MRKSKPVLPLNQQQIRVGGFWLALCATLVLLSSLPSTPHREIPGWLLLMAISTAASVFLGIRRLRRGPQGEITMRQTLELFRLRRSHRAEWEAGCAAYTTPAELLDHLRRVDSAV
jgi:hypothetical protein